MIFQVKLGDNFPQNICKSCAKNLDLMYNFKTKAISCDLELSKNVRKDIHFTYIQVSDDHSNVSIIIKCNNCVFIYQVINLSHIIILDYVQVGLGTRFLYKFR